MPARAARPVRPIRRVVLLSLFTSATGLTMSIVSGLGVATAVQTAVLALVGSLIFGGLAYHREIADVIRTRRQS